MVSIRVAARITTRRRSKEGRMKKRHTYTIIGSGVDTDGWFKYELRRDDGKVVKVGKARVRQLRQTGQLQ